MAYAASLPQQQANKRCYYGYKSLDRKEVVTVQGLAISNMLEIEALRELLFEKGIIGKEGFRVRSCRSCPKSKKGTLYIGQRFSGRHTHFYVRPAGRERCCLPVSLSAPPTNSSSPQGHSVPTFFGIAQPQADPSFPQSFLDNGP